jgi:hypothetical protein
MAEAMRSLAEQFPLLSFAAEADAFLAQAEHLPLTTQLMSRRVISVFIIRLKIHGVLSRTSGGPQRGLHIQLNVEDDLEQRLLTLGHELAHTFEWPFDQPAFDSPELAEFCDEFARRWLRIVPRPEVEHMAQHGWQAKHTQPQGTS